MEHPDYIPEPKTYPAYTPAPTPAPKEVMSARKRPDVWFWSGKLPGCRRRRKFRFERIDDELRIPSRIVSRDDVEPELPQQAEFLDAQRDLLRCVCGDTWRVLVDSPIWDELKQRLEDCAL